MTDTIGPVSSSANTQVLYPRPTLDNQKQQSEKRGKKSKRNNSSTKATLLPCDQKHSTKRRKKHEVKKPVAKKHEGDAIKRKRKRNKVPTNFFPSNWHSGLFSTAHSKKDVAIKRAEVPAYSEQLLSDSPLRIEYDNAYEHVNRLLSNNGKRDYLVRNNGDQVPLDTLHGKLLVISCFFLPVARNNAEADYFRAMILAYPGFMARSNGDFEMVVVAKMSKDWVHNEAVFNHFFSLFPGLTIPFGDSEGRDYVCRHLGLTKPRERMATLVVDPKYKAAIQDLHNEYFLDYGASYPFTADASDSLYQKEMKLRMRVDSFYHKSDKFIRSSRNRFVSLAELFSCEPTHKLRRLICDDDDDDDEISVSELSKKNCVGVYICLDGYLLQRLDSVQRECLANNQEFEIVVVYVPLQDDPTSFLEHLEDYVSEYYPAASSWWVLPYNDEVSRRLRRILDHNVLEDRLIIARPDGNSWDVRGKSILINDRSTAYPFTGESIFERMSSLTLETLLGGAAQQLTSLVQSDDNDSHPVTVGDLRNRNVLVYIDYCHRLKKKVFDLLLETYPAIKEDVEVVFLTLGSSNDVEPHVGEMPWLMRPISAAGRVDMVNEMCCNRSKVVAFGKDGRIRSLQAQKYLGHHGTKIRSLLEDKKMRKREAHYLYRTVVDQIDDIDSDEDYD